MARKTRIKKEINGYTLRTDDEEFYKHNKAKGLAVATQDIYKVYVSTSSRFILYHTGKIKRKCFTNSFEVFVENKPRF